MKNEITREILENEKYENKETLKEMFNEEIRNCSNVNICSYEFDPAEILEKFDPVAYNVMFNDYISSLKE